MLFVHFVGLAMGLGTSFAMMFLARAALKLDPAKRGEFMMTSMAVTRMGHIGLGLLILSGGYLMTPWWGSLGEMPYMVVKLVLVVVMAGLIGWNTMLGKRMLVGDPLVNQRRMKLIGSGIMLCALAIVALAIATFH